MTRRVRTRRSAALTAAIFVGLSAPLTACGSDPDKGTNGVQDMAPATIEKKARAAVEDAESVRLSGTIATQGHSYRLEMRLKDTGAVGEVATRGGETFSLLRVKDALYLKAGAGFWVDREQGDKGEPSQADLAAAQKLEGKYVKVPDSDPAYARLTGFTKMDVLLEGLLVLDGERSTGDRMEVAGVRTVQVVADGGSGGSIAVSLEGTPFPLRLKRAGGAGTVQLDEWNQGFAIHAPKDDNVVDYGKKVSDSGEDQA
ncbi:hypothetical protein N566_25780 [Streptomycetaceae bacterium MP113-05]|nr:hypothetical protein N566_25780 [Streptomycetaceae bacterium MP113-05]